MKSYPPRAPAPPRHIRVPAFAPAPLRPRCDGWTPARQAAFLAALAATRLVAEAARRVGMARETAYRLRRRAGAESFAAAWDRVLGRSVAARRKVTADERARRALAGLLKPLVYRGRHVATLEKPDNSALLAHLARLDRTGPGGPGRPAAGGRSHPFAGARASPSSAEGRCGRPPRRG